MRLHSKQPQPAGRRLIKLVGSTLLMFAVLVTSVALYLPATRLRCAPVRLQLQQPKDELKVGFSRGSDDGPKTSFAPSNPNREKAPAKTVNEELMDEIQLLMPPEKPAPKEAKPVDLNGIKPRDLLFGLPVGKCRLVSAAGRHDFLGLTLLRALGTATHSVYTAPMGGSGAAVRPEARPQPVDPAAFTHPGSVRRRTPWCATRQCSSCWDRPPTSPPTPSPRPTSTSCRDSPPSRASSWWAWRPSVAALRAPQPG